MSARDRSERSTLASVLRGLDERGAVRAETVTAIAVTVTAVAALVVAVWDNVQTRRHNRLSVLPVLAIDFEKRTSDRGGTGTLSVQNAGTGPARIDSVGIALSVAGTEGVARFGSWIEASQPIRELGLAVTGYANLGNRHVLAPNAGADLLRVAADSAAMAAGDPLQDLIDRLGIRIVYRSVYEERFDAEMNWP